MERATLSLLRSIRPALRYVFWPNPGGVTYVSSSVIALLVLCVGLVVLSFVIRSWRMRQGNAVTRKLSRTWSSVSFWFGIVGATLVIARVEQIQFFAMRFLWLLWALSLVLYVFFQARQFRARHYRVLPKVHVEDPRARYLPGKKR